MFVNITNNFNYLFFKSTDIDWKAYWDAKIKVQNVLSETRHDHWKVLQKENGEAFVIDKQRIKATFAENLELLLFS